MNNYDKVLKFQDKLSGEYLKTFEEINFYLTSSDLDGYLTLEVLNDILDILISAQERGEDIKTILGGTVNEFCENIVKELKLKSSRKVLKITLDILFGALLFILLISINPIVSFFEGKSPNSNLSLTIGEIFLFMLSIAASYAVIFFVHKKAFSDYKESILFLLSLGAVALIMLCVFFLVPTLKSLFPFSFQVSSIKLLIVMSTVYFILKYIYKKNL